GGGQVKLWDLGPHPEVTFLGRGSELLESVRWGQDSRALVIRDEHGHARVLDPLTGLIHPGEDAPADLVNSLDSPDGRYAVRSEGALVVLLDRRVRPALLPPRVPPGQPDTPWHTGQLERAERARRWYPAAFHLGYLAQLRPWDAGLRVSEAQNWASAG